MHHQKHAEIRVVMHSYAAKGKKSAFKKIQMRRLIAILDDIFKHEHTENLDTIGKRQIVGYWRRTEQQTAKTRREKYNILVKFFSAYNVKITVPEPKVF